MARMMILTSSCRLQSASLLAKAQSARCYSRETKPAIRANLARRKYAENEPFPFAVTPENKDITVRKAIEPLFDVPYEEQLLAKESYCKKSLRHISSQLYQQGTPIRLDVRRLPCHFNSIIRSPIQEGFRSKDEYSIWRGYDGTTEIVGHTVFPTSRHGDTVCIEPDSCKNPKPVILETRKLIQKFIQTSKKLPVCYNLGNGGWRRFALRVNRKDEVMIIGQCNPRGIRVQDLIDERENFRSFMVEQCEKSDIKLASIYFQACPSVRCSHEQAPFELLHGSKRLAEQLFGLEINISPDSMIPDNPLAAEKLYEVVLDVMDDWFPAESKKPLVIDLNCGIGILSLILATKATRVVGVENKVLAVEDARLNAKTNGIDNCDFYNTNPEIAFEKILQKYKPLQLEPVVVSSVTAAGMHRFVAQSLRECHSINKFLYISSKIGSHSALRDMIILCEKKSSRLPPFIPVSATPVDSQPNAESCNLVLAMERLAE